MSDFQELLNEYAALAAYIDDKEDELAAIKKARDNAKAAVMAQMATIGISSGRSSDGHAVALVTKNSAKVEDSEAFFDFVFECGDETFLHKAASADRIKQYADEHNGELPPGITMATANTLRFTRAKK